MANTFRGYLAEQGAKPIPLAEVTAATASATLRDAGGMIALLRC